MASTLPPCQSPGQQDAKIPKKPNMPANKNKDKRNCLLCNVKLGPTSKNSVSVFGENALTSTENPIINVINSSCQQTITKENCHSSVICKKCLKLVNEADELDTKLKQIRQDLCNLYMKTTEKLSQATKSNEDVVDHDYIDNIENKSSLQPIIKLQKLMEVKKKGKKVKIEKIGEELQNIGELVEEELIEQKIDTNEAEAIAEEPDKEVKENDSDNECDNLDSNFLNGNDDEVVNDDDVDNNTDNDNEKSNEIDGAAEILKDDSLVEEVLIDEATTKKPALDPEEFATKFEDGYKCSLCTTSDKRDAKTIIAHLKSTHDSRLYICDVCGDMFRKRTDLSHHLDDHVAKEEGDFQCEVCNRIFNNLRLFRIHKRIHYPQIKSWTCDVCVKRYSSKNLLDEHMNTHTGNRPYICEVCGKDFASKYTYRAHVKTHQVRPRPFECHTCKKTFLSQQNLAQHVKTHNGVKDYVCATCGKAFGSAHNLEVHNIVHTGYKPYICRTCGKAFARKAEIRDHERTHTGEKPYQCEFCGATFSQRSNLQSHKRATHYNDKRYKCDDCGKGFKRRRLLDYHIKAAHTGERPHKCPTCSATFVYPEHYKKHMRIHTGEKPYLCEVCGKAFNSRDNRNAHRFIHSDKKPYECLVCGTGFMRKPLLYAHMQSQNHLNDTIVVNQPRLTTDEEEAVIPDNRVHLVVQGDDSQSGESTHMIVAELKDNQVIIQDGDQQKILNLAGTNVGNDEDFNQLVIDGQMSFDEESNEIVCKQEDENEGEDVYGYQDEEGNTIILPPGTNVKELLEEGSNGVQFVQIRLPSGSEGREWLNLVPSS